MSSPKISVVSSFGKIVDYDSSDSETIETNKKTQIYFYNENDLDDSFDAFEEKKSDEVKNEFVIDKSHKNKLYLNCVQVKPLWKARVYTNLNYEKVKIVNLEHIHEPPIDYIATKNVRVDIKKRASETSENPRKSITYCLTKLPLSSAPFISTTRGLTQMVQRKRQKVSILEERLNREKK
ncbi:unnamed protein product [Brachionus calyciflorus]|uniref:FLYWCH-type domain-containing protein n=1 Tax=Brachionus calyciflorus TaxID=104777 RepID=A0A814H5U5_9BILA|nr:unnamed protein product [Brachionus calyciflorus]